MISKRLNHTSFQAIPKTFCGGFEFKEVYKPDRERLLEFWRTFQDVMLRLYSTRLSTIAAVQVGLQAH